MSSPSSWPLRAPLAWHFCSRCDCIFRTPKHGEVRLGALSLHMLVKERRWGERASMPAAQCIILYSLWTFLVFETWMPEFRQLQCLSSMSTMAKIAVYLQIIVVFRSEKRWQLSQISNILSVLEWLSSVFLNTMHRFFMTYLFFNWPKSLKIQHDPSNPSRV